MASKIDYRKYIDRLLLKRENSPYYAAFRAQQADTSLTMRSLDQQLRGYQDKHGTSIGAMEQAAQARMEASTAHSASAWGNYSEKESARQDAIDNRIDQLEMAKEQQDQQRAAEKKARKKGILGTIAQVGGMVLGAGLTLAIPGAGAALGGPLMAALQGASIGGGLGQVAGSFASGDGGYGLDSVDPRQLMQGIGDTISGISSTLTLKSQKTMMSDLTAVMPKLKGMSSDEIGIVAGMLGSGLYEQAIEYMRKYSTGEALPADIINLDDEYLKNRDAWNKTNYGSIF